MSEKITVLMVDDHPMIIEGYKNTLLQEPRFNLSIDTANNCDSALDKLASSKQPYEIIFLDIRIPACEDGKIISGEGLGMVIRKDYPSSKIIILTMFSDKIRLSNILRNLNPEGFLVKSDVTPRQLLTAVKKVLEGEKFFSGSVQDLIPNQNTGHPLMDDYDHRILYYLARGTKTKDLVDFVPLSLGAIEKRKRKIKEILNINQGGDKEILDRARESGFL